MQERAVSAAAGVVLYLDFKTEKLWVAQVGQLGQPVIGQLFHGLAVQRTQALVLGHADRCPICISITALAQYLSIKRTNPLGHHCHSESLCEQELGSAHDASISRG